MMKNNPASLSHLPVLITVKLDAIEALLNQQMPMMLHQDTVSEDDGLLMKVERSGDLVFEWRAERFYYQVPLSVWVKKKLGPTSAEATASLVLSFATALHIQSDWSLNAETEFIQSEWLDKPTLKLGIFNVPAKRLMDLVIRKSRERIGQQLDQVLEQQMNLRPHLERIWPMLNAPIPVPDQAPLHLKLDVRETQLAPFSAKDSYLQMLVFLIAQVKIVGQVEASSAALPPIPALSEWSISDGAFDLRVGIELSFDDIERLAATNAIGQKMEFSGRGVTLQGLSIDPSPEGITVQVRISGDIDGTIKAAGMPVYHANKEILAIDDPEIGLDSDNFLMKGLAWLANKGLKSKIEEMMRVDLSPHLDKLPDQIKEQLKTAPIPAGVEVQLDMERPGLPELQFNDDMIQALFAAKGMLAIRVDQIPDLPGA